MSTILCAAAVLVLAFCALIGYGFIDNADLVEDYQGWLALGLSLLAASFLPWARFDRRPR